MKVGLFSPCYIDQCYPEVGMATVELLERHRAEVDYPGSQTGCGQPMANSGSGDAARPLAERFDKVGRLLAGLDGIELVEPARADECCGFGGTFAVGEDAVSCAMGRDRLAAHERAGAQIVTATDMSCLMHLDGLIRRDRRPLRVMHVAEILAAAAAAG